jgi:hypothetical protein
MGKGIRQGSDPMVEGEPQFRQGERKRYLGHGQREERMALFRATSGSLGVAGKYKWVGKEG